MPNKSFSRLEHVYSAIETTYGQAASVSGANAMRNIELELRNTVNLLRRRDKTGTRTAVPGVRGRINANWTFSASLVGSGTPATASPHDVLLQLLFGQASAAGVYTLADVIKSASIYSYRTPSTLEQRVALGAVLQNFEFTLGQDVAEFRCDGECQNILTSATFAGATTPEKGGLGAFPVEPVSPTYTDGGLIAGFTGAITIDGQTVVNIRQATIKGSTGNALPHDLFGSYVAGAPEGDVRAYTFSFNTYDDDSAALAVIKEAADQKTIIGANVQIGTIAGSIATFTLAGIQLDSPTYNDQQRAYVLTFGDSPFVGSNPTALDEMSLAWT